MDVGRAPDPRSVRCTAWIDPPDHPEALVAQSGVLAVDVVDRERLRLLAERGMRPEPPAWTMLLWSTPEADLADHPLVLDLALARHDGWGDVDDGPAGAVLMVSLVGRSPEVDHPTFMARYRDHVAVARRHHGFTAYRQNVGRQNVATGDGTGPAAVSEILLASEDDWRDRFYVADDSAEAVAADVARFLDRRSTSSTIVRRFAP